MQWDYNDKATNPLTNENYNSKTFYCSIILRHSILLVFQDNAYYYIPSKQVKLEQRVVLVTYYLR